MIINNMLRMIVCAPLVIAFGGARAADAEVPPQARDPDKCAIADKVCFKEWYDEYKVGLR